ncbi:MAG: phage head closure protein [Clostridium baratii]|nr:phage head closure protein [Clostridium baratii]
MAKKIISIGNFDKRIDIGTNKGEIVGGLQQKPEFKPMYERVWSEVKPISMKKEEFLNAQGKTVKIAKEFTIRYKDSIDESMCIRYKNELYNIVSILPYDENENFLTITGVIYK